MNKARRKQLNDQWNALDKLKDQYEAEKAELKETVDSFSSKWAEKFREVKDSIETLKDEEQEYYDQMPEGLQNGEKGSNAQDAVNEMEEAMGSLEELADGLDSFDLNDELPDTSLEDILTNIDNAKGAE